MSKEEMTDALTTGAERLAGIAAAYMNHIGPVDEHTVVTVDAVAFITDPGVKALVEFAERYDSADIIGAEARLVLRKWERGDE